MSGIGIRELESQSDIPSDGQRRPDRWHHLAKGDAKTVCIDDKFNRVSIEVQSNPNDVALFGFFPIFGPFIVMKLATGQTTVGPTGYVFLVSK